MICAQFYDEGWYFIKQGNQTKSNREAIILNSKFYVLLDWYAYSQSFELRESLWFSG